MQRTRQRPIDYQPHENPPCLDLLDGSDSHCARSRPGDDRRRTNLSSPCISSQRRKPDRDHTGRVPSGSEPSKSLCFNHTQLWIRRTLCDRGCHVHLPDTAPCLQGVRLLQSPARPASSLHDTAFGNLFWPLRIVASRLRIYPPSVNESPCTLAHSADHVVSRCGTQHVPLLEIVPRRNLAA